MIVVVEIETCSFFLAHKKKMLTKRTMSPSSSSSIRATNCLQANASETQKLLWSIGTRVDDQRPSTSVNNTVIPLIIKHGSISIENIRSTVSTIIERFTVLRTAIYFDESHGHLVQAVQPLMGNDNYSFELTNNRVLSQDEITALIEKEITNNFARLDRGLVVRCHLIKMILHGDAEHLQSIDMIIFAFHPIAFNSHSVQLFLDAFKTIYNQTEPSSLPNSQYIDLTLYQYGLLNDINHHTEINEARQFWSKLLHNYSPNVHYSLSPKSRTMLDLDVNMTGILSEFAASHNVPMMQLGLTCFMCFLHEYSNCTINDLCVAVFTDEQAMIETKTTIGPCLNIQPYRIQFNSKHSLADILTLIRELNTTVCKYAQFPYLLLMNDTNALNLAELPFHFQYYLQDPSLTDVISLQSNADEAVLNFFSNRDFSNRNNAVSNDLTLTMLDNHDKQTIQFIFEYSSKYSDQPTINERFENFLRRMFTKDLTTNGFEQTVQPITQIHLHLQGNIETTDIAPDVELKKAIANIWEDVIYTDRFHSSSDPSFSFDTDHLSTSTNTLNFSSLGGDSLQFVQVYQRYQSLFNLDVDKLPTRSLFEHNTIDEHVKLIAPMLRENTESQQWRTLHIHMSKMTIRS